MHCDDVTLVCCSWAPALGWLMTVAVLAGLFGTPIIMMIMASRDGKVRAQLFTSQMENI